MKENPFVTNNKNIIRSSFLIVGLTLVLLLAFFGNLFLSKKDAQAEVIYWTNYSYRANDLEGDGTKESPYRITNASELALMAYWVNNGYTNSQDYFSLENNISLVAPDKNGNQLVWEPIGTDEIDGFKGKFNGNGCTISGLKISQAQSDYAGLFGYVNSSGIIENVKVEGNISLTSNTKYVGGIIAYKDNCENNTISKLYSNVNINAKAEFAGGVVGYVFCHTESLTENVGFTIQECMSIGKINNQAVSKNGSSGGIVAQIQTYESKTAFDCEIKNCLNTGNITNANSIGRVGGIIAKVSNSLKLTLTNCYNSGKLTGNDAVGGIVGENAVKGTTTLKGQIKIYNCTNIGNITGKSAGGIAAFLATTDIYYCSNKGNVIGKNYAAGIVAYYFLASIREINNSYNEGSITVTDVVADDDASAGKAGGIVGYNGGAAVLNCHNDGVVNALKNSYIGGIVGFCKGSELKNCTNYKKITSKQSNSKTGGIVGYCKGSKISYCSNQGRIVSENSDQVGGIIGLLENMVGVSYCSNQGNVTGKNLVGGIAGDTGTKNNGGGGRITLSHCINAAQIFGNEFTGGIVGDCVYVNISKCVNFGSVFSSSWISVGGIVGRVREGVGNNCVNWCINYGKVETFYKYNKDKPDNIGVGGIIGCIQKSAGSFKGNVNIGQVWADKYEKEKYRYKYTGQIAGRNEKDDNENTTCYCVKKGIQTFGTSKYDGTDESNGTPLRTSLNNIIYIKLADSYELKSYEQMKKYEKSTVNLLTAAYDTVIDNLMLPNFEIEDCKQNFTFYGITGGDNSDVWRCNNSRINNGEPYLKRFYW